MIRLGYLKLPTFCFFEELEMQHCGFSDAVQSQGMRSTFAGNLHCTVAGEFPVISY